MRILIPLMIPLVLGYGYFEGRWTDRWQPSRGLEQAVARLGELPLNVGEWDGEASTLDDRQIAKGEIQGYVLRRYTHRLTGRTLSILLVCGRPGPMSLHTPEVCYPGAGFSQQGAAKREKYAAGAEFWVAKFNKPDPIDPEMLRISWAWNADGAWTAPDQPRFTFASRAALYKLYVIQQLPPAEEKYEDLAADFLKELLPAVERQLFAAEIAAKP